MGIDSAHRRSGQLALLTVLAMVATACTTGGGARGGALSVSACALTSGAAPASLTFALNDPVAFNTAPVARNGSQRTVYRQLYETLVLIDCTGSVRPDLAASWSSSDAGRVWQFRVRPGAVFWDGAPVTAAAIASSLS